MLIDFILCKLTNILLTTISHFTDQDVSIDSNLATMDNMNDLRHRLRLLEKSILELKRGGSRRYENSRRDSRRGSRRLTTRRRTVRAPHGAASPGGSCAPRHDGEGLKPGDGGEQDLLGVEVVKMEEQQFKLKGQLGKMERMLKTLVTPEQLAAEYDDDDDDD